jgi:hypothetical protein
VHSGDQETVRARTAILISGMHRSGTSAITRVLSLLGARLPGDVIEAKNDNERGFWEGRAVIDLDEQALAGCGSWWGGWQAVDTDQLLASGQLVATARKVVREGFPDAGVIALKDPRVSRVLPLWQRAFEEEGVRCLHVVALRDPAAVADSLWRRNALSPEASTLSWLAHTLDADQYTRDQPRVFVAFENLLRDWRSEMHRVSRVLDIEWPDPPEVVADIVDEFIEPGLAHTPAATLSAAVTSAAPVYDVLRRWSADDRRAGDEGTIEHWRSLLAPVREPHSAVALVARERQRAVQELRSSGRKPGRLGSGRWWRPLQNQALNLEADAAWAWLMREKQHDELPAPDATVPPRTPTPGRGRR